VNEKRKAKCRSVRKRNCLSCAIVSWRTKIF